MIASGEKKEEYREIKPYWVARLVDSLEMPRQWELNNTSAIRPMDLETALNAAKETFT